MQMTVRFMAPVRLPPFPVCRPTSLQLSTTYLPGCIVIGSSKMLRRLRWCDAHRLVDSRNFLDVPSRSLVLPLNRSARSVIWVSTSTSTLAPPPMFEEPCRGVLLHYGNFVYVGLPVYLQRRLQAVLNAAARLVFRLCRYDHVTDALAVLHWLRLPERVNFKLALMAYRVLNGMTPS